MGAKEIYVDESGKEYVALSGSGKNVRYHPDYPTSGYYQKSQTGGCYRAHLEGTDPAKSENWSFLNFIDNSYYENYSLL